MEGLLSTQMLPDVDALVHCVEDTCRSARPLSSEDLARLTALGAARVKLVAAGEDPSRLRNFGQRLWCACSAAGATAVAGHPEATLRQVACELFSAGLAGAADVEQPHERAKLAAQWAFAGRAWSVTGSNKEALQCFEAACEPWAALANHKSAAPSLEENITTSFAEAACQAYLWASDVYFKMGSYDRSFQALTEARTTLGVSEDLRLAMSDDLLMVCYEQALAQRNAKNAKLAVELLTLALASLQALGPSAAVTGGPRDRDADVRCRLMRHLALAYAADGNAELALSHAREAASLAPASSSHQAACLQVWLDILWQVPSTAAAQGVPVEDQPAVAERPESWTQEVRSVLLNLMRLSAAPPADRLAACQRLLEKGFPEDGVFAGLAELSSRLRAEESAEGLAKVLTFRLQVSADGVKTMLAQAAGAGKATDCPASARLHDAVTETETATLAGVPGLRPAAVAVLRQLSGTARDAGCLADAVRWLERALSFADLQGEIADIWCELGSCHRRCGSHAQAGECATKALAAESGHLHALMLALFTTAGESGSTTVEKEARLPDALNLLERIQTHPSFSPVHANCIAQELLSHPNEVLALAGLEALARRLARATRASHGQEASAAYSSQKASPDELAHGLMVVRELVVRTKVLGRPDSELIRYLDLATEHVSAQSRQLASELQDPAGISSGVLVSEVRRIFSAAWERGQTLGREGHWARCAAMLEAALRLLQQLDSVDVFEVLESRAWCLAMIASASHMQAKAVPGQPQERNELCQHALHCIDRVHQLRRTSCPARSRNPEASAALQQRVAAFKKRVFNALVLLEFEVRCLAGDCEIQLRNFVDQSSSSEEVGIKSLLAMSKIAAQSSSRRLAVHCLQRYLRVFVGACGVADYSQCAGAYREMIAMHASRNESFATYEGIMQLLNGSGGPQAGGGAGGTTSPWPQDELAWLVSTAWNNGVHFCKLQQYRWGEKWMAKSLALMKFCPGNFQEETMREHYMAALQRVREAV